jgi:hypothetical protein
MSSITESVQAALATQLAIEQLLSVLALSLENSSKNDDAGGLSAAAEGIQRCLSRVSKVGAEMDLLKGRLKKVE